MNDTFVKRVTIQLRIDEFDEQLADEILSMVDEKDKEGAELYFDVRDFENDFSTTLMAPKRIKFSPHLFDFLENHPTLTFRIN